MQYLRQSKASTTTLARIVLKRTSKIQFLPPGQYFVTFISCFVDQPAFASRMKTTAFLEAYYTAPLA
jgi:hypothetical protein